jgi:hypothetical protein
MFHELISGLRSGSPSYVLPPSHFNPPSSFSSSSPLPSSPSPYTYHYSTLILTGPLARHFPHHLLVKTLLRFVTLAAISVVSTSMRPPSAWKFLASTSRMPSNAEAVPFTALSVDHKEMARGMIDESSPRGNVPVTS